MHIRIAGLFVAAAAVCAACTPAPGSAEWCKGVLEGTIKATESEVDANDEKCGEVIVKEMTTRPPGT